MGKLEVKAAERRRRGYLQSAVLAAVGIGGLLAAAPVAAPLLAAYEQVAPDKYKFRYRVKGVVSRLVASGSLTFVERGGKKYLELTDRGRRQLDVALQRANKKPKRWDGRWRIVIFDIPEKYRKSRTRLTTLLRTVGFVLLQNSVWVYPYDCEDVIAMIKADLGVGRRALYVIADTIENDALLRRRFGLK